MHRTSQQRALLNGKHSWGLPALTCLWMLAGGGTAGHVMPALADNFRVSADGLSYLFQIRGSARWSDGVPVTAHDFVTTWNDRSMAGEYPIFWRRDSNSFAHRRSNRPQSGSNSPRSIEKPWCP